MSRPNKCIKDENGNEVWISRSNVVIPIVFKVDKKTGNVYTLLEERGPAVSHCGEWCCPCGYIDWDETLVEACVREVREETGLELDDKHIYFFKVDTNKYSRSQTIDHWYQCWTFDDFNLSKVETKDEILDLKWLKVATIHKTKILFWDKFSIDIYKDNISKGYGTWAFKGHHTTIMDMLMNLKIKHKVIHE